MESKTRIGIGAITRRRPQMFSELLDSFARMQVPEGVELVYLFAENDETASMTEIAERFGARTGREVRLELETRQGIPMARNRVLDMAFATGCDFLTFVDDDETVYEDWLVELYKVIDDKDTDLVGGPVDYQPPEGVELGRENRAVLAAVQEQGQRNQVKRKRRVAEGEGYRVPIYTNNWIARLSRVKELGIRFDEALRYTGGSDTRFYKDFREAGGRTSWASDAFVREVRPLSRLTYKYYFERCRDQEMTRMARKRIGPTLRKAYAIYALFSVRAVVMIALSPLTGGRSRARAMRVMGRATGRLMFVKGRQSDHYDPSRAHLHEDSTGGS